MTQHVSHRGSDPKPLPDFSSHAERDAYFAEHGDFFTVVQFKGVGKYERAECDTLAQAESLAKTRQLVGGGRYMIYAIIGTQSAFVKSVS